jgi:surface antigen
LPQNIKGRISKKQRRKLIRLSIVTGNILLLIAVGGFIFTHKTASQTIRTGTVNSAVSTASAVSNPLDQLSSAQIALQVAQITKVQELTAVKNQADSEVALMSVVPNDPSVIAKPQIISTAQKSRHDIIKYTTVAGDTVSGLATKYGVSANSIKWSNTLSSDNIKADTALIIPPAEGIVYKVKSGDTIDSITSKYQSNKDTFVSVNDAENGKLPVNDYVWIPNGIQPVQVTRFATAGTGGYAWGYSAVYGGNGYDYGWCTWWSALRRSQIGEPVPSNLGNAITWKSLAAQAGLGVGTRPAAGAVIWFPGANHVGFVEKVNPDGSIWISEMAAGGFASMDVNSGYAGGWGRVDYRLFSAQQAASYWYIY